MVSGMDIYISHVRFFRTLYNIVPDTSQWIPTNQKKEEKQKKGKRKKKKFPSAKTIKKGMATGQHFAGMLRAKMIASQ